MEILRLLTNTFTIIMDFLVLWLSLELMAQTQSSFDINWRLVTISAVAIILINLIVFYPVVRDRHPVEEE